MEIFVALLMALLAARFRLTEWLPRRQTIEWSQRGLVMRSGAPRRLLTPGTWTVIPAREEVVVVDVLPRLLQLKGQEVMTADPVAVRVNLGGTYEIADPALWATAGRNPEETLYLQLQLAVRELISSTTIEALLADRAALNSVLLERAQTAAAGLGARWTVLGLKDVLLPADVRQLIQGEVEARKKAQARLVSAREETAIARMQANTARLFSENPMLLRLQELEALKSLAQRPGSTLLAPFGVGSKE